MKVLIVGGGGREHALARKLRESPRVTELYCVPGNAGIEREAVCAPVAAEDVAAVTAFAEEKQIDLAVIGPEVPLALGLTDRLTEKGIRAFGPDKNCARLEASKSFTKAFLKRHNIPTARYRTFTDKTALLDHIGLFGFPMVLKADGPAAGKGVILAANAREAEAAVEKMMGERAFGDAGDTVVVEEYLAGTEASMLCFVDGSAITPMASAQDYKRVFDGDEGPNTGGMGAYSPSLIFDEALEDVIRERILAPTFEGFIKDGLRFKGVLFVGLMITDEGPKVVEFNNRFGDPETQVVIPRLKNDLVDVLLAVTEDRLSEIELEWRDEKAVCVVLAAEGYPGAYEKGKRITGLDATDEDVLVFHAGTRRDGDDTVTAGGRVLGVTALARSHEAARRRAYENAGRIAFEGAHRRGDIGLLRGESAE